MLFILLQLAIRSKYVEKYLYNVLNVYLCVLARASVCSYKTARSNVFTLLFLRISVFDCAGRLIDLG